MGEKDMSTEELMKRLSAIESKMQDNDNNKRLDDFIKEYGSKFGNDRDIASSFLQDIDARGVEINADVVEELLQALREEVAQLSEKISMIVPDTGAMPPADVQPPPDGSMVSDENAKNILGTVSDNADTIALAKRIMSGDIDAEEIGSTAGAAIGNAIAPGVGGIIGSAIGGKAGDILSDEEVKNFSNGLADIMDMLQSGEIEEMDWPEEAYALAQKVHNAVKSGNIKGVPVNDYGLTTDDFDEGSLNDLAAAFEKLGKKPRHYNWDDASAVRDARDAAILSDARVKEFAEKFGIADKYMSFADLHKMLLGLKKSKPKDGTPEGVLLKIWENAGMPSNNYRTGYKGKNEVLGKDNDPKNYTKNDLEKVDGLVDSLIKSAGEGNLPDWAKSWLSFKDQRNKDKEALLNIGVTPDAFLSTEAFAAKKAAKKNDDIDENEIIAQALSRKY
mgnify:CR=1 FL=1